MNIILQTWKRNLKWILFVAVIVGLALSAEKMFFTDTIVKSDRYYVEQEVAINYIHPENVGNINDYKSLFHSFVIMNQFFENTKDEYDYSKWDAAFSGMTKEKQLEWLQKHIMISNTGNKALVYSFDLPASTRKDDKYVEEHGQEFLNQYIAFTQQELNKLGMESSYQEEKAFVLQPQAITVKNETRAIKYGVVGFVLGGLLSMMVLGIKGYFKKTAQH